MEIVEDHFLQICLYLLHLPQDDSALSFDFRRTQRAVLNDVSQDFHSLVEEDGDNYNENPTYNEKSSLKLTLSLFLSSRFKTQATAKVPWMILTIQIPKWFSFKDSGSYQFQIYTLITPLYLYACKDHTNDD